MRFSFRVFLLFSGITFILSCQKDDVKNISLKKYDPSYSYQIAYGNFTLKDLIGVQPDSLKSLGGNALTFVSTGHISSQKGSELMTVPNPSKTNAVTLSPAEIITLSSTNSVKKEINDTILFPFPFNAQIKKMKIKSGSVKLRIDHYFQHNTKITLSIPLLKLGAIPISHSEQITFTGSLPVFTEINLDLSGYSVDLSYGSGIAQNALAFSIIDSMNYLGNPVTAGNHTDITVLFSNLRFSYLEGDFGSMPLGFGDAFIPVDLFKKTLGTGSILFDSPSLDIVANNSFGLPINKKFPFLYGHSSVNGNLNVESTIIGNGMAVNPSGSTTSAVQTSVHLNPLNSNLVDMLAQSPSSLYVKQQDFNASGTGISSSFIGDQSECSADFSLTLPLSGKFIGFTLMDTIRINMDAFSNNPITSVRVYAENGFPVDADIVCWMLDTVSGATATIFYPSSFSVPSASIDGNNIVTPAIGSKTYPISSDQFKVMLKSQKLIAKITLTLPSANSKLTDKYSINLKIGASVKKN